jgi:hypothetical protein
LAAYELLTAKYGGADLDAAGGRGTGAHGRAPQRPNAAAERRGAQPSVDGAMSAAAVALRRYNDPEVDIACLP